MIDFLTNNGAYMTLVHCMNSDWFWIGLLLGLCLLNSILYFAVFYESYSKYRKLKTKTPIAKGFLALSGVFAFCALAGYMTSWIGLLIPHYRIKVILLIPVTIAAMYLVYFMKRSDLITRMFALEKEFNDKIE